MTDTWVSKMSGTRLILIPLRLLLFEPQKEDLSFLSPKGTGTVIANGGCKCLSRCVVISFIYMLYLFLYIKYVAT